MYASIVGLQAAATTSHFPVDSAAICSHGKDGAFHHLHMAWALVADRRGILRPRVHWVLD